MQKIELEEARKSLTIIKQEEEEKHKETKILRDKILFEEILTKNVDICVYDCLGYVYKKKFWGNFILLLLVTSIGAFLILTNRTKRKRLYTFTIGLLIFLRLVLFHNFRKYHIEKIIYHTNEKKFTLFKKGFFGRDIPFKVHKNNLIYTRDDYLNSKGVNFINMENLELYKIGFVYAWKEKALFAYLIGQNIK